MEKQKAEEFCHEWLEAWTGNRPEHLISFYSKDAFYRDPAKSNGLKGRQEILPYFRKLLSHYPTWEWKAVEIFPQPEGFILKWEARVLPTDQNSFLGMDIVEVDNGQITRNEVFFDPSRITQK